MISYLLLVWGGGLLLLFYTGFGVNTLLMPAEKKSSRFYLAPLTGFALLSCAGYYGVISASPLFATLIIVVILATILNGVLAFQTFKKNALRRPQWRAFFSSPGFRTGVVVVLITLFVYFAGCAPLLSYGYRSTIGLNWDTDIYIPMAAFLQDHTLGNLATTAPAGPYPPFLTSGTVGSQAMGFSYFQGMLSLVLHSDPFNTFVPTLALITSLNIPVLYAFVTETLRIKRPFALFALVFYALNSLVIWLAYNNFAMQIGALPFLPGALWSAALLVQRPSWRTATLIALYSAATGVIFLPVLTILIPLAFVTALFYFCFPRVGKSALPTNALADNLPAGETTEPPNSPRLTTVLWSVVAGLLFLILGLPVWLNAGTAFLNQYNNQKAGMGITWFISLPEVYGFAPWDIYFDRAGHHFAGLTFPPESWSTVALLVSFFLAAIFILYRLYQRDALPLLLALVSGGYLYYFYYGHPYAYGYFKASGFCAFLLPALAAGGLAFCWEITHLPFLVPLL